jgi:hypothetical protein
MKKNMKKRMKAAGHELKVNPPSVLAKTRRKKGAKQAEKQRVAIMFSKARRAGKKR